MEGDQHVIDDLRCDKHPTLTERGWYWARCLVKLGELGDWEAVFITAAFIHNELVDGQRRNTWIRNHGWLRDWQGEIGPRLREQAPCFDSTSETRNVDDSANPSK